VSTSRTRAVTADQWGVPERDAQGNVVCRWCRGPVARPRRTFCGDACVHEWKIRSSPWYVRREVKKRDKGICQLCGTNVVKAHRAWTRAKPPAGDRAARKAWRAARPRWEADHIVPVADGGGECGLENYRLLCRPCHVRVTGEWRLRRQAAARQSEVSSTDATHSSSRCTDLPAGAGGAPGPAGAFFDRHALGQPHGSARDSA
jgi:5-methylcytosine-specific restriction endonuclease McrA